MAIRRDYKCELGHYFEVVTPGMANYEQEIDCPEHFGLRARVVITRAPEVIMDNVDQVDYTVSAGRNFSNRRERDAWLKEHDAHIADPGTTRRMEADLAQAQEERLMVESRGHDYGEYCREKRQKQRDEEDRMLADMGVSLELVDPATAEAEMASRPDASSFDEGMAMTQTATPVTSNQPVTAYRPTFPEPPAEAPENVTPSDLRAAGVI